MARPVEDLIAELQELSALREELDTMIATGVRKMRGAPQYRSWAEIGAAAGLTAAEAEEQWGEPSSPHGR